MENVSGGEFVRKQTLAGHVIVFTQKCVKSFRKQHLLLCGNVFRILSA